MWYEILPSLGIIYVCMYVGLNAGCWIDSAAIGKPHMRKLTKNTHVQHYKRDERITGNPYVLAGLENIPDKPE